MEILFDIGLVGIILVCVAVMQSEGMWSNAIALINTIFSGLLAFAFFEPLADFAESQLPSFAYYWDFLSLWAIFAASMGLLQQLCKGLSGVKVRFRKPVAVAGNSALLLRASAMGMRWGGRSEMTTTLTISRASGTP